MQMRGMTLITFFVNEQGEFLTLSSFKHMRARVIFVVIGALVELFTVMIWLSFWLGCTARKKVRI